MTGKQEFDPDDEFWPDEVEHSEDALDYYCTPPPPSCPDAVFSDQWDSLMIPDDSPPEHFNCKSNLEDDLTKAKHLFDETDYKLKKGDNVLIDGKKFKISDISANTITIHPDSDIDVVYEVVAGDTVTRFQFPRMLHKPKARAYVSDLGDCASIADLSLDFAAVSLN